MPLLQPHVICWDDSRYNYEKREFTKDYERKKEDCKCYSIGFVLKENTDQITICQSYTATLKATGKGYSSGRLTIPKAVIHFSKLLSHDS